MTNTRSHASMPTLRSALRWAWRPLSAPFTATGGVNGVPCLSHLWVGMLMWVLILTPACAQTSRQPVIAGDSLFTNQVYGLSTTNSTAEVLPVSGEPFSRELKVTIGNKSDQTNATQMGIPTSIPVHAGDSMLASFYVRGSAAGGQPAHTTIAFGLSVDPWTKSITQGAATSPNPQTWKRVLVPFTAIDSYQPGQATVWLFFAFGPQTVEIGGLSVVDYGKSKSLGDLEEVAVQDNPLGTAHVAVDLKDTKQTFQGFGGDFCQPRYGSTDAIDPVGHYNLAHLKVVQARVGIPLNFWTPQKGQYTDSGPAHAAFLLMQDLSRRHVPIIGTVWEGPTWMLPGKAEQSGRILDPSEYGDCIDAIIRFLTTARDTYGVDVAYFSFNEADYGVNFKFTPQTISDFIRQAGPRFRAAGLKTTFLVGDTGGGAQFPDYVRPILADKSIAPYLGPLAFHCWDSLGASESQYAEIASVARETGKPIYCTEVGWDAGLWQKPDPWASWDNGFNTALAYAKTLDLTGASTMDYWTYENNYPLVSEDGTTPYPVFHVIEQMQDALPEGCKIATATSDNQDLTVLASSDPTADRFSLLLVNSGGQGTAILSGLPPNASVSIVSSDSHTQNVPVASLHTDSAGALTVALPERSVVTLLGGR